MLCRRLRDAHEDELVVQMTLESLDHVLQCISRKPAQQTHQRNCGVIAINAEFNSFTCKYFQRLLENWTAQFKYRNSLHTTNGVKLYHTRLPTKQRQ